MSFANPQWLILFLALIPVWYLGWPRRAFRRRRDVSSLLLRTVLITCVVLAVSGLQVVRAVDRLAVIFLVDASDSIGSDLRESQIEYIRQAVSEKPADDTWGVVVFGAGVSIDKPLNNVTDVAPLRSEVTGSNTNIAAALQTAISLFPADARRRIVILSDGQQTIGDAEAKARLADVSGVEISYVPFFRERLPDVRITDFQTPAQVAEGQVFDLTITVESETATPATIRLFSGGQLVQEEPVQLNEGSSTYTFSRRSAEGGFRNFEAQIDVPGTVDSFTQNNRLGAFSEIVGSSSVLLVSETGAELVNLLPALESAGMNVDVVEPGQLPADMASFVQYASIIIANVPATGFSDAQMQRLDRYVSDLGGGLVFVGGPQSYGPGGYYQTILEDTLPLEMRIRDQERLPQLTIAYLIDSSGSMGALSNDGIYSNLQLSLRAVERSIDFLQPDDRVAIGTFDSSGQWVARFQPAENRADLQELLSTMRPGGGTDILNGLRLVERDIGNEPSERKHLILLTDGGASRRGLVEKVRSLNGEFGVTTSVIAIGNLQVNFLQDMAEVGQGNFHRVTDVSQIPGILSQETVLATRSYIQEGAFSLNVTARSPIMQGINSLPPLQGYVAATPKDTAQVILRGPDPLSDPILAQWQYGLGRAVAFTGDASSRWSPEWVTWEQFSRFWGQAVEWTITENIGQTLEARVIMQDNGQARLVVDARTDEGAFLNNLVLQSSVITPQNTSQQLRLSQTAPGRYETSFTPESEGAYFLAVNGEGVSPDDTAVSVNERTGWVMSYSPEYAQTQPDEALLARLASLTGGRSLAEEPQAAFAVTQEPRTSAAPAWPFLLLIALLILPFDIAVRRLIITRSDLQRLREYLFGAPQTDTPDERLSSLLSARERARQKTGTGQRDPDTLSALKKVRSQRDTDTPDDAAPDAPQPRRPRSDRPETGRGTVSDLLKRRRERDTD